MKKVNYGMLMVLVLLFAGCPLPITVNIFSPSNCEHFDVGSEITFTGSAIDIEEGVLMGDSLIWSSNKDGQIGTGTTFSRDDLSSGTHEILLTAKNSNGETEIAKITIIIGTAEEGDNDCDHDDGDHDDGDHDDGDHV
jgi:hypothetical protein